jgi:hypothetical protein
VNEYDQSTLRREVALVDLSKYSMTMELTDPTTRRPVSEAHELNVNRYVRPNRKTEGSTLRSISCGCVLFAEAEELCKDCEATFGVELMTGRGLGVGEPWAMPICSTVVYVGDFSMVMVATLVSMMSVVG